MNKPPVPFVPGLDVHRLLADFERQALQAGFRAETFGRIGDYPLRAFTKRTPGPRPRIYLSAGIHGDEPAPPQTLLEMMATGAFDARATWFVCPVLNPTGLAAGIRENRGQRDLNRDYKDCRSAEVQQHTQWLARQPAFDLTLCLHEDWEATGFYLYELNPHQRPSLAAAMIAAAAAVIPIEPATIIDDRAVDEPGIIRPVSDPLLRENWPEAIYLRQNHTTLSYTVETPSGLPLAHRIKAMRAAVEAALKQATRG